MYNQLKCADCGGSLVLRVVFDGCDWFSVKGEGSRFDYEIELYCDECGRVYPIGRLKNEFAFCENVEQRRPYGRGEEPNNDHINTKNDFT